MRTLGRKKLARCIAFLGRPIVCAMAWGPHYVATCIDAAGKQWLVNYRTGEWWYVETTAEYRKRVEREGVIPPDPNYPLGVA